MSEPLPCAFCGTELRGVFVIDRDGRGVCIPCAVKEQVEGRKVEAPEEVEA